MSAVMTDIKRFSELGHTSPKTLNCNVSPPIPIRDAKVASSSSTLLKEYLFLAEVFCLNVLV
jgi:hypothetical protein